MDLKAGTYLTSLLQALAEISDNTLSLFKKIRLSSRHVEEKGQRVKISTLNPNSIQKTEAATTHAKYEIWSLQVASLLGKYSPDLRQRFSDVAETTLSYILFKRIGQDLTSKKWRDLFVREFSSIIAFQRDLLIQANEEFLFRKPHFWCFKNHQPCNVDIKYDPKLVFVLMPFSEPFDDVYELGIKSTVESFGLKCIRADEILHSREIMCKSICQPIQEATLIVTDLTGRNPNVYYELGLCHGFEKEIILTVQDIDDVPFDLRAMSIIIYKRVSELQTKLTSHLHATMGHQSETQGGD